MTSWPHFCQFFIYICSQVVLVVKISPANAGDIRVQSLSWEDPLEESMATPPMLRVFLLRESPWTQEPGGLQSIIVSKDLDTTEVTEHALDPVLRPPLPPHHPPSPVSVWWCLSGQCLSRRVWQCLLWILESSCTNSGSNSALHCVTLVKLYNLFKSLFQET